MTGLDVESEATVRQALDRLMAGKNCLMITHDLPSITDADLVLLLEEGRIIERGTHSALMPRSSRHRRLPDLNLRHPASDMLPSARRSGRRDTARGAARDASRPI